MLYRTVIKVLTVLIASLLLAVTASADSTITTTYYLAHADLTFVGEAAGDWTAYSVSPAGDVNGDGYADLIIGSPFGGAPVAPGGRGRGKAYLILGKPNYQWSSNVINLSQADASFLGCKFEGGMTGRQNYTAGDVNGDGLDDFLISGWKCGDQRQGIAFLFLGRANADWGQNLPVESADASFIGPAPFDFASYYNSTAGDVNGDGYDDFLITSPQDSSSGSERGRVYLILGRPAADWGSLYPLSAADASFIGEHDEDNLGRSTSGVGDVNGDGYDDFMIGSIESNDGAHRAGEAYLILGRPQADWGQDFVVSGADASFIGQAAGDEAGRRVAGAGDVNGDGYTDLLVASSYNDQSAPNAGKVYLILGKPNVDWGLNFPLANANAGFLGEAQGDQAGRRVSDAGDVNKDGYADFLIGAPHSDRGGVEAGAAYLIYGRPQADWGLNFSLSSANVIYIGKPNVPKAGYDVAGPGDMNGDSYDDVAIGAFGGWSEALGAESDDFTISDSKVLTTTVVPGEAYVILNNMPTVPVQYIVTSPRGRINQWWAFKGTYQDLDGWRDISSVQIRFERYPGDFEGFDVLYNQDVGYLYLRNGTGDGWLGPCHPNQPKILYNGFVKLDCLGSTVTQIGDTQLQLKVWVRWNTPITEPRIFNVYLEGKDHLGPDSGFIRFGTWILLP